MPALSLQTPHRITQLEDLARASMASRRLKTTGDDPVYCYAEKLGINLRQTTEELRLRFPNEPLLALDIGGARGEFALRLQGAGYRAFCLDPRPGGKVTGLAARSIIIGKAEEMDGIPDQSFHLVTSIGALSCREMARALHEVCRVLRSGGEAFLDLQFCDLELASSLLSSFPSVSLETTTAPCCFRILKGLRE